MKTTIEKEWRSETGYTCRVVSCDMGHRCGYVGTTNHSIYYEKEYDHPSEKLNNESPESFFEVHGGITFSGKIDNSPLWWYGFDCAHWGDGKDLSLITNEKLREIYATTNEGTIKDTNYCIQECEKLAKQMQKFDPFYQRKEKLEKLLA